jgi:periplasmic copper chaperone A
MRLCALFLAAALALLAAAAAQAHVTVHPNALPAGGEAMLAIDVPDERSDVRTVKLEVEFPAGFVSLDTQPVPGWTAKAQTRKLAKPVTTDDGAFVSEVDVVTWTATDGGIGPGQFLRFPFSAAVPDRPGAVLTFKALQTYSDGSIVYWIGPPAADEPAPQVLVTEPRTALADYPADLTAIEQAGKTRSHALAVGFAIGLALLALALAAVALVLRGRRSRR